MPLGTWGDEIIPAHRSLAGRGRALAVAGVLLALGLTAGGCSIPVADLPLVGLPANTPPRPVNPGEYPAVHDIPAPREDTVLDRAQQDTLEKELLAARDRQASGAQAAQRHAN